MSNDNEKDLHSMIDDLHLIIKEKDETIKTLEKKIEDNPTLLDLATGVEGIEALPDSTLVAIIAKRTKIEKYIKAVTQYLVHEMLNKDRVIDGLKLIKKTKNRAYKDEAKAIEFFKKEGFTDDDIFTKKIKSPTQMEKNIPITTVAKQTFVPEGEDTVAPV